MTTSVHLCEDKKKRLTEQKFSLFRVVVQKKRRKKRAILFCLLKNNSNRHTREEEERFGLFFLIKHVQKKAVEKLYRISVGFV